MYVHTKLYGHYQGWMWNSVLCLIPKPVMDLHELYVKSICFRSSLTTDIPPSHFFSPNFTKPKFKTEYFSALLSCIWSNLNYNEQIVKLTHHKFCLATDNTYFQNLIPRPTKDWSFLLLTGHLLSRQLSYAYLILVNSVILRYLLI